MFTRRDFVRQSCALASCALIPNAASALMRGAQATVQQQAAASGFALVLHGLFALDFRRNDLVISSPDCTKTRHKHMYLAGHPRGSRVPVAGVFSPSWSGSGTKPDGPEIIRHFPYLPGYNKLIRGAYLTLIVPYPDRWINLRSISASVPGTQGKTISVALSLEYDTTPDSEVFPKATAMGGHLHLYAEPGCLGTGDGEDAFGTLLEMLGNPKGVSAPAYEPVQQASSVPKPYTIDEQKGLGEITNEPCHKGGLNTKGADLPTCIPMGVGP